MNTPRSLLRKRVMVPLAAAAALAIGAAPVSARPIIDSVDIERLSSKTTRIEVETERSSVGTRPRVRVWVAGRSLTLPVVGRDADGDVLSARTIRWSTREYDRHRIRVRVCAQGACAMVVRKVAVDDDRLDRTPTSAGATGGNSLTRERAARIARERFGGYVDGVQRESDYGARWEVELENARFNGSRRDLDVYVNAVGKIVKVVIDD